MILLIGFAFLAGIITILSPCILPVLPILLTSSFDGRDIGKGRAFGVVTGFVLSFTFFTLFLSVIVRFFGIPASLFRNVSIVVLFVFGLSLFVPKIQILMERFFSTTLRFIQPKHHVSANGQGFLGGLILGVTLGLLWTPCVGPILASVISLALSGTVTVQTFFITAAYSLGTALPMFFIMQTGSTIFKKNPWLLRQSGTFQKGFGVLMVLTAIGIFFNIDRQFQTMVLNTFPQYGTGLTAIEDTASVKQELKKLQTKPIEAFQKGKPMSDFTQPKGPVAPELKQGGDWFNSNPLILSGLRGKVVLVDFWTYSCINCQRTIPFVRSWWETYKNQGLVIIGVHAPEFEFEKDSNNVKKAISDFSITYPVMQDNEYATWRAYDNHYWPAKYLIDKDGVIRYTHFGEGNYAETEKMIQQLLDETGIVAKDTNTSIPEIINYAQTPETYLGYARIDNFVSPETIEENKMSVYSTPSLLSPNTFAYTGNWTVMSEYANPKKGAQLLYNFDAKEVYLVARPKSGTSTMRVYLDDSLQAFGEDNISGTVMIHADKLYKLIRLTEPGRHILRLQFEDDNTEVYAFTFG
jgi:cytochrome c biogenesis protein CcdA/thiol-disulfide isomerase/thioredoxin